MDGPRPLNEQDEERQSEVDTASGDPAAPKTEKPVPANPDVDDDVQEISDSDPGSGGGQ